LQEVLATPVRTPEEAQRASEAASALAELLRAEQRAGRLLGHVPPTTAPRLPEPQFDRLTLHAAAEVVLRDAGTPLHATELGRRITSRGWHHKRSPHPRADQIVSQLAARLPRHPDVFRRVAPNTFALTEWDVAGDPAAANPRLGTFHGPGDAIGRWAGDDHHAAAAAGQPWRSS
jgi:HB1, ASXL, restriction endonuclease HTH domain